MLHVCMVITAWLQSPSVNDKADNECAGFHFLEPAWFYFTCKASSACYYKCLFLYKSKFYEAVIYKWSTIQRLRFEE